MEFKRKDKRTKLQKEIDDVLSDLKEFRSSKNVEAYREAVDRLEKLYKCLPYDKDSKKVDANTLLTVASNVLGICLILYHEKAHVISTKALQFVTKLRM